MRAFGGPADLEIKPRNVEFGRGVNYERWWCGGDPVVTAFFNALSLTFPQGESFFVNSVRRYLPELSEPLRGQVEEFAQQEAYHSREHMAFNRQVAAGGYETKEIDALIRKDIQVSKDAGPEVELAVTAALEHFTGIFAHAWLSDPRHFKDFPDDLRRLWQWHSIEEIEHKGVAFDTFLFATRDLSPFKRWLFRTMVMGKVTFEFWKERFRDIGLLLKQDGLDNATSWRRLVGYLVARPGLFRQVLGPYLAWYAPGFHPWRHDDRALAAQAEASLSLVPAR